MSLRPDLQAEPWIILDDLNRSFVIGNIFGRIAPYKQSKSWPFSFGSANRKSLISFFTALCIFYRQEFGSKTDAGIRRTAPLGAQTAPDMSAGAGKPPAESSGRAPCRAKSRTVKI